MSAVENLAHPLLGQAGTIQRQALGLPALPPFLWQAARTRISLPPNARNFEFSDEIPADEPPPKKPS